MQDILARAPEGGSAAEEAPSLLSMIWREKWVVLICVVLATAVGVGLSQLQAKQYTAHTRVFMGATQEFNPLGQTSFDTDATRFITDQAALMTSSKVLNTVIQNLDLNVDAAGLRDDVSVAVATDSNVMTIAATAGDPRTAARISIAVAGAYRDFRAAAVTSRSDQAITESGTLTQKNTIRAAKAIYGDGVSTIEDADTPRAPSKPNVLVNGLILALIGFLAGVAYALYSQSASRRKAGPAEASVIFGAPILSEVPDRGRISPDDAIAAAYSEPGDAYRMAAVGLDYIRGTAPGVFLVTAPHDGAGSSLTALNLAAAAADHGRRVFLLNIEDTVRPQSEADAGLLRVPLHDLAQGRIDLGHAVERRAASRAQFGIIRLQVLQPVQGHPVADVQQILDQLPDDTDLVLLDAPPLPASSASFVLAGQVDAAVLVMDEETTPAELEECQRRCRLAGIPVAGVLVNHIRSGAAAGRRKRHVPVTQLPVRNYDTSPRGLPLLAGDGANGDGRVRPPEPGAYGHDHPEDDDIGWALGRRAEARAGAADVPWSSITRVGGGWDQEGRAFEDDGDPGRGRSQR